MITLEAADQFHSLRGNDAWAGDYRQAALLKASDWIRAFYPLAADTDYSDESVVAAYALLALEMLTSAPALKAAQAVKSEEVASGDDSLKTVYQDADKVSSDPYPHITALLEPFRKRTPAVKFGRMV